MGKSYSEEEKELVKYFKEKLISKGVTKFPRDWHLKQLSVARYLLSGENSPSVTDWKSCIDWAFNHQYWGDKVDHLSTVERLWIEYKLKAGRKSQREYDREAKKSKYAHIYMG